MDVPAEIAFRNVEPTATLERAIEDGIASLEKVHPRLVSCRVMVEEDNRGFPHVRLDIAVPGSELVVTREAQVDPQRRDIAQTVREAFDVARRQLRERRKRVAVDGKRRDFAPEGRILRLIQDGPAGRTGYLLSGDGREVYFHEDALRDVSYDELEEGMEVTFVHASGRESGQASAVSLLEAAETPLTER